MAEALSFQGDGSDRLPPQNIEAEEAVLGGILLDPEAIGRVSDRLKPEAFYISAHKEIYQAALRLHQQGKPTDLLAVTSWLADHDLLNKIGGRNKLATLVDRTVSAVNIDALAALVVEKHLRRKLIKAGNEVVQLGYETETELPLVLDKAEQKVFSVTQEKPQSGLVHIGDALINNFQDIEERNQGIALPGISSGFYDLDGMVNGGFQRSDLIIIAGRPAMGKCVAFDTEILQADGSIATIAEIYHHQSTKLLTLTANYQLCLTQPSAYIDDGIKPVFRVTTHLGRTVETTITHPYLTENGWCPLAELKVGDKIAVPNQLNIFGQETISQCQLKSLADVIDKTDAIAAIIFKLTRSQIGQFLNYLFSTHGWAKVLKNSQLQLGFSNLNKKIARQVQHLLLRFGILATLQEKSIEIQDNQKSNWHLYINHTDSLKTFVKEFGKFSQPETFTKIESTLAAESQTKLITIQSWLQKSDSLQEQALALAGNRDSGNSSIYKYSHQILENDTNRKAQNHIYWDEIISIEPMGHKQVYDLTIPITHNFIANDICVHNTSFSMNIAHYIASSLRLPTAIFSLEMSREQLAQRLLASEAQIESSYLRSGRISQNQWEQLTHAIDILSDMPIFIDDTPNITITEMRSQARRLQAEQNTELGLILIDYLQLMEGAGDNRVQELSRITRSLKSLARELSVPVIALSQLSRGVESRTNKRPMLSDLRESGCLTGNSLVTLADTGLAVPIKDLVGKSGFAVWGLNESTMKLERAIVSNAFSTGVKPVFSLKTRLGRTISATGNHKFLTINGWKRLDELSIKQHICLPRHLPSSGKKTMSYAEVALLVKSSELLALANSDVYWDEIVAVIPDGEQEVFDLTVPHFHNFVANNIVVHNSIEQDADLVIMLYRDDYYNPDSPDRGIAEVIIAKHRNGPTGTVKLLFDPQFTKFKNLARSGNY
jgi:replicative DNA helicase